MTVVKKHGKAAPPSTRSNPRAVSARDAIASPSYPSAYEALARTDLRGLIRAAVRAAAWSGVLVIGSAGCADPVCSPSSTDELLTHSGAAARDTVDLQLGMAVDELGVGLGITPHTSVPMMAGEMVAPVPTLPAPAPVIVEDPPDPQP